tara:strand:+ start:910 stop:1824 length:915 start_codon:yes stop_codon:yes gene_type:complete
MSGGGGGSGNDGSNDTQVSGAEAFYSNEPGVSTHAESKVTKSSGSGAPGGGDSNMYYDAPDTSMVGKGGGNVFSDDEYDEPDKAHWKDTQKKIKAHGNEDIHKMSKDEYENFNKELNEYYGTEDVKYEPHGRAGKGTVNLSFKEHWDNVGMQNPVTKFSPIARFLMASGRNAKEFLTSDYGTHKYGGPNTDQGGLLGRIGGSGGDISTGATQSQRDVMNELAPEAPYIVSGIQRPTNSPAAQWYQSLGNTSTNQFQFSFANELSAAKAKQASILGNQSAVGWLAVNQSPFYNFLKERKLDKGIL